MAAKTSQIMAYPPPCLTVGGVLTCCTWLSPNMVLCIIAIDLHFLERRGFLLTVHPNKPYLLEISSTWLPLAHLIPMETVRVYYLFSVVSD